MIGHRLLVIWTTSLARPLWAKLRLRREAYVLLMFKNIFSDFCQTNYFNIYRTYLYEICRIGRTLAADERSEVIFFDRSRDVAVATKYVGKIDLHSTPRSSDDIR